MAIGRKKNGCSASSSNRARPRSSQAANILASLSGETKERTPKNMSETKLVEELKKVQQRVHHKLGSSPLIMWLLGLLTIVLWLAGTVVQIQTSEYLALGRADRVAGVDWVILSQPWLLITGRAPLQFATAWEYAWVVELVTLVFALALAVAVAKISSVNPHLARWFVIGTIVLVALNGYADYSASPGASPLVQFLIALALGGIVVVGLPLGVGLIEHGMEEF
jgi:hypothetical protein